LEVDEAMMTEKTATPSLVTTVKPFGGENGHPKYEENMGKAMHEGLPVSQTDCCYCGKKAVGGKIFAYLTSMGVFAQADDFAHLADDHNLGLYPVGSDCAKLLKRHGVALYRWGGERI